MVVNVDTKINEIQIEMHDMKAEILEMNGKIESSKSEVLEAVDEKVDCNKNEIVNSIHNNMTKIDKISEVFVKIVASQNTLSSSLKGVARNLPQRDVGLMMNKHELSQSLGEIKQIIQRNKPMDTTEMVGHLKQMKDVVKKIPKQGEVMTKQELQQQFNDVKAKIQDKKESQGATGG